MLQIAHMPRAAHAARFGPTRTPRVSLGGAMVVLALHAGMLWLLLQNNVLRLPLPLAFFPVRIIASDVIQPTVPVAMKHGTQKPPKQDSLPTLQSTPVAASSDAPAPEIAALPSAVSSVSPAPTAAVTAISTPPRFDADYLDNPAPRYPPVARSRREQGLVMLRVNVDANGVPTEVLLHSSSGIDALDQSAISTVRRWRFVPAKLGDTAVAAWVLVPINFKLKD